MTAPPDPGPPFDDTCAAPWWLPGGHAQTIIPARLMPAPRVHYRRERWDTPDGDFIDLDWSTHACVTDTPLVVLFHGLEGSSASHYARGLTAALAARQWEGVVVHFRGCSGSLNLAPRFYHSGDGDEIDWVLRRLYQTHCAATRRPLYVVGISLGGNALLRFLGERREDAAFVTAAASVSAPLDLTAGGIALSRGFNMLYTRMFLQTLKTKALAKLKQYPGLFDADAMLKSRDLYAFDNIVTAPLHGYRDTDDYWHRASGKLVLDAITVPTLVLNARNDPFLPAAALPRSADVSPAVTLSQPAHGGHVGFFARHAGWRGHLPPLGQSNWLPLRALRFFDACATPSIATARTTDTETAHG
ncbi:YheT family hydrolase [Imbroritus primus]|uniref:YheT family hydrolase n=1 Tax=Imbroritus primus TaxID=3058603 RepID=UPI003D161F2A